MKKNIKQKIDRLLSLVIIGILLPLFVTIIGQRMQLEQVIYGEMQPNEETTEARADMEEPGCHLRPVCHRPDEPL